MPRISYTFGQHHEHFAGYINNTSTVGFTGVGTAAWGFEARMKIAAVEIHETMTIDQLFYVVGDAVNGTIRIGIYEDIAGLPDGGALLAQAGPAAPPGTLQNHFFDIADLQLPLGRYWIAVVNSDAAATHIRIRRDEGTYSRFAAIVFAALPDPCPVTALENNAPIVGVRVLSIP